MSGNLSFKGRTIALTGGGSGIGLATTLALSSLGAEVYACDITKDIPSQLADVGNVHFTGGLDVSSREACHAFINGIQGRLDGLIQCAGVCPNEGKMASDEIFDRIMGVNIKGTFIMGTEAIIRMSEQESRIGEGINPGTKRSLPAGAIVNIASGAGLRGVPGLPVYCASKHAVVGLTRSWAAEWPALRINAVAPGLVDTPMVQSPGFNQELLGKLKLNLPLNRMVYPTDITDTILFLLSDAASFITGQVHGVNGGTGSSG